MAVISSYLCQIHVDMKWSLPKCNWLEGIKLNWMELHNMQSHKMQQLLEKHVLLLEKKIGTIQGYKADERPRQN